MIDKQILDAAPKGFRFQVQLREPKTDEEAKQILIRIFGQQKCKKAVLLKGIFAAPRSGWPIEFVWNPDLGYRAYIPHA